MISPSLVMLQVTVFQQPNYLANFVQSSFDALPADKVKGTFSSLWLVLMHSYHWSSATLPQHVSSSSSY